MKTYSRKSSSYLKKAFVGSNFNEMCRLCLSENETVLTPIIKNWKISYQEWIQYSVDVLVEEDDGLPPNICDECLGMVEQAYLFKKKCKASDSKLREHFELLDLTEETKTSCIDFNELPDENNSNQKNHHEEEKCDESSAVDSGGTKQPEGKDSLAGEPEIESATQDPKNVPGEPEMKQTENSNLQVEEYKEKETGEERAKTKDTEKAKNEKIEPYKKKSGKMIVKEVKRYILRGEIKEGDQEEDLSVCEVIPLDVQKYEDSSENGDNIDYVNMGSFEEGDHEIHQEMQINEVSKSSEENSGTRIQEIYKLWGNEEDVEEGTEHERTEDKVVVFDVTWEDGPDKGEQKEKAERMEVDLDSNGSPQTHRVYMNKNHIKIIETRPQKSFSCFACSEIFSTYTAMKEHLSKYHKDVSDTPFCEICGKSFTCTNSLKRHMAVHTGFKPYKCKICERKFSQGSILKRHILTHENQKPFNCHICQKSYTQKMNLLSHLKSHGFRTGAESFSCKMCSKTFVHQSGLSRHVKLHKGVRFLCVHCKKSFGDASALARHVKSVHQQQT